MIPGTRLESRRIALFGYAVAVAWLGTDFLRINVAQLGGFDAVLVQIVGLVCGGIFIAGAAVAFLPCRWSRDWPSARLSSTATVLVTLSFAHQAVRTMLSNRLGTSGLWSSAVFLAGLVIAVAMTWHLSRYARARLTVALTSATMLILSGAGLGAVVWQLNAPVERSVPAAPADRAPARLSGDNVYYVILDQYSGPTALKQYGGSDISPFLTRMGGLGFTSILGARANYTTTYAALMAILEMRYVAAVDGPRYRDRRRFFPSGLNNEPPPALVDRLGAGGYAFIHIGNSWAPCRENRRVTCVEHADEHAFKKKLVNVFLEPTRLPALWAAADPRDDDGAMEPLRELSRALGTLTGPSFVFTHNLPPHEPFLTADCRLYPDARRVPERYAAAIECVNRHVEEIAGAIVAADPTAIVVFQGDHGSDFNVDLSTPLADWPAAAVDERTSILNLVRAPEVCQPWLRERMSPVNTVRFVVGCLERREPEYLPEKTYLSAYENQLDFGLVRDVTELAHPAHREEADQQPR